MTPLVRDIMTRRVDELGLGQREIARRLGISQPHVRRVLLGEAKPPLEDLDRWADVLELWDEDRVVFIRAARLAHAPPEALRYVQGPERRLETLESPAAARVADDPAVAYGATLAELRRQRLEMAAELEELGKLVTELEAERGADPDAQSATG